MDARRATAIAGCFAAFVVCAAFFLGADPWDPLAGWGWATTLAAALALGLVVGRWTVLAAVLVLLPLATLNRTGEPGLLLVVALPVLVAACAIVMCAGLAVRSLVPRSGARYAALAAGALAGGAVAATAWGAYLDRRVVDRHPSQPVLVDDRSGALHGIVPGSSLTRARRVLGRGVVGSDDREASPLGVDAGGLSGPSSVPDWQTLRLHDLAILHTGDTVRGYVITDRSAQTQAGVGIGDSLVVARRRYANLACAGVTLGSDAARPDYLACVGRMRSGDELFFGGDPIDSIWVLQHAPGDGLPPRVLRRWPR